MAKKKIPQRTDAVRRENQNKRLARALRILELIQGHGNWNLKNLAAEIKCSERSIRRDLQAMELAGVSWYKDERNNCYRVPNSTRFPISHLDNEEALGLALATSITKAPGLDVGLGSRPTLDKITRKSGEDLTQLLLAAEELVSVLGLNIADHSRHREQIRMVQWALVKKKQVEGLYKSPYDDKSKRLKLHPYRLCLLRQAWYLVARVDREERVKTYRVARFQSLRMTDSPATVPTEFDLHAHFGNAWTVFRGDRSYAVKLLFSPEAASVVKETIWHHTQQTSSGPNGSLFVNFKVDGLQEILWWVLGWAGRVTVIEPDELRTMVLKQLETAVEMNR